MKKNQYLIIQDACDEASMLTHKLIGHMLWEFAKFDGLDLNGRETLYLKGDNEIKDMKGIFNFLFSTILAVIKG